METSDAIVLALLYHSVQIVFGESIITVCHFWTKQIKGTFKKRIEIRARIHMLILEHLKSKERSCFCVNPGAFVLPFFCCQLLVFAIVFGILLCCCMCFVEFIHYVVAVVVAV